MLSAGLSNYLKLRRSVGFKLATVEKYLQSFVNFSIARSEAHIVAKTVLDWAAQARSEDSRARRLDTVIHFARFVHAEDPRHVIPPNHVFCKRHHRRTPNLLNDEEVARLLVEAGRLMPATSLRPHTYRTIFGLLASTGLRISEALNLRLEDVTPDGLMIRETKFRKSRLVPLHGTVMEVLVNYINRRQQRATDDPHIFVSHRGGGRLHYDIVATTFRNVLAAAAIPGQPASMVPRLHDLRHRFAVKALQTCPNSRDRIANHMVALSTYMGHARVESTYWYLETTPSLMTDIADVCESFVQGVAL